MADEAHASGLFNVLGLEVTSTMTTMVGITVALCAVSYFASRRMKAVPGRFQGAMELAVESLRGYFGSILGDANTRRYLPLLGTMFLFIIVSNYSGLLPMAGHTPGLAPPTASLSVTAGLAAITFFAVHTLGIKHKGTHYFKHFFTPYFFMVIFLLIEEIVRPVSLALRLFGNISGEETVASQIFGMIPLIAPLPFYVLGLLFGLLQAIVFTTLTSIYINGAIGEGH
ncbi:MAG: F0F1 ATP synthase subunit A [Clostridiales bacterium]|nr:F0F1 ATP synthase subunit A [Clostridiales bacterium]